MLSSDGQEKAADSWCGAVEWTFSRPGDYTIDIFPDYNSSEVYTDNLPLRMFCIRIPAGIAIPDDAFDSCPNVVIDKR